MRRYDVFLSGPVTGVPDYRERFAEAERRARTLFGAGARVWNPARLPAGKSARWYMVRCMGALWRARRVLLLEGYSRSRGARIEVGAARYIGVPVVHLTASGCGLEEGPDGFRAVPAGGVS